MNFDFGDVLTRAWKITWNHKVLWVISVLPLLTMFLILPFWLILLLQKNVDFNAIFTWMENPIYRTIAILAYLIVIVFSMVLQIASRASLTLGIYRAEAAFGVLILPLMVLFQGFSLTYIKSAIMLTYLQLTRPELSSPLLPGIVEAPA